MLTAWLGVIAYGFQLYFDFSGYSDMAIGLGRMLGFRFLENFNYQFLADSITDFWRRWHISMGTWFRDYVYIPLGGNRGGLAKQLRNIAIVWLLTGFWHGASWNFVLWGVYSGVLLVLEKLFLLRWLQKLPAVFRHIYALVLVTISWTLFAFTDIAKGIAWLKAMFSSTLYDSGSLYLFLTYGIMLAICALAATPLGKRCYEKLNSRLGQRALAVVDCGGLLCVLTAHSSENIYYRTDHHWTSLGAYYAYCAWRGIELNADEWTQEVLCENFRGTTWNKVPLPTVPAEEITAWYKHADRSVSYNAGQYETDSIYERKYLDGSDQYAVFLNSNQAQTVIEGSGKSGKFLLIKDSYGNTFSQFPVEDYAEVHVLDPRFFKGDVAEYAKQNGITDALVLYGTQNFVSDTALSAAVSAIKG